MRPPSEISAAEAEHSDSVPRGLSSAAPQPNRRSSAPEFWTALSTVAALVAALFAGWAAWETRRGALETGKATRAAVWLQVLTEYAEPAMLNSMKALRKWREDDPVHFATTFQTLLLKPNKTDEETKAVNELDEHRRRVMSFFNKLSVLAEGGVIDEEFVSATWSSGTYTYINDVLMPMERAKADALFQTHGLNEEDKRVGEAIQSRILIFYRRVAERSKERFLH